MKSILILLLYFVSGLVFGDIKIAVVGGSAAKGYDGLRGLTEILQMDFNKNFPNQKVVVEALIGLASPDPFYRGQAETVKVNLKKFDQFVFYTGNTEVKNYLHDSKLFIQDKYKDLYKVHKLHYPIAADEIKKTILERIWDRVKNKLVKLKIIKPSPTENHQQLLPFQRFSNDRIPPVSIYQKALDDFLNEVENIIKSSDGLNKKFYLSTVPSNLDWTPWFSFGFDGDLADLNLDPLLLTKKYPNTAEFWYQQGKKKLIDKEYQAAFYYLKTARDLDGFFVRTVSSQHNGLKKITKQYNNSIFIDPEEKYLTLVKNQKISFEELFSSLQHPSLLGNIISSREIFCSIVNSNRDVFIKSCPLDLNEDLDKILERYKKLLNVTANEEKDNHFMIARWHVAMMDLAFLKNSFIDLVERELNSYQSMLNTIEDKIRLGIFKALLEIKKKNIAMALTYINNSYQLSSKTFLYEISQLLPTGVPIESVLRNAGIIFDDTKNKFDLEIKPR